MSEPWKDFQPQAVDGPWNDFAPSNTNAYIQSTQQRTDRINRLRSALKPEAIAGLNNQQRLQLLQEIESATPEEIAAAQARQEEREANPEVFPNPIASSMNRDSALGGDKVWKPPQMVTVPGAKSEAEQKADLAEIKTKEELRRQLDPRDSKLGIADTAIRGAADALTFGGANKIAAAADAVLNPIFGTGQPGESYSDRYDANKKEQAAIDAFDSMNREGTSALGSLAGGAIGAAGLARQGLSLGANAINKGRGLGAVALNTGADGAIMGGLHGFIKSDGDWGDKAMSGTLSALGGAALGGAAPIVLSGLGKAINPIASRMNPQRTANIQTGQALQRSGKSADDIVADLNEAQAAGQTGYTVADALGHPGQRMLSTVTRSPNEARTQAVESLVSRQGSQGRRISNALQEASGTKATAAQYKSKLQEIRDLRADQEYDALRESMGAQPVWHPALQALTSRPSIQNAIENAANTAAERGYEVTTPFIRQRNGKLALPEGTTPTFDFWLTVKRGLENQLSKDPTNRDLNATKKAFTNVLDGIVPGYKDARASFAQRSQEIRAIDRGSEAAKRGRPEDTIPAFQKLSPGEQNAFRPGYFDRLIEASQGAPGVNKARPLLNDANLAEFPVFSAPGRDPTRFLQRENRMNETMQTALGGSKTYDNFADAADVSKIDPSLIGALLRGRLFEAAGHAGRGAINELQGRSPRVLGSLGERLMQTNPQTAAEILLAASNDAATLASRRALINAFLTNESSNRDLSPVTGALISGF